MTRLCACLALCVGLTAALPVAHADPVPAPATPVPLRIQLRVVDTCRLDTTTGPACATAHQRSDAATPAPPQVQALTPAPDGGATTARAWQTLTF